VELQFNQPAGEAREFMASLAVRWKKKLSPEATASGL
jgi:hypothetical protein